MTNAYVGRFAPSPTGSLHLGNLWAAAWAYARARQAGGQCLLRIDDLDTARCSPESTAEIVADLGAMGFVFDEGPCDDGGSRPYTQSNCQARYQAALDHLRRRAALYACRCSRRELREIASAPHGGELAYPGICREKGIDLDGDEPVAWRFISEPGAVVIDDLCAGPLQQDVQAEIGDFVVRRKDGLVAYHLACVVDDHAQGITEVVRGRDLLPSTPRQVLLQRALGFETPAMFHMPLLVDTDGKRLEKRSGSLTVHALLEDLTAAEIWARLAQAVGLSDSSSLTLDDWVELLNATNAHHREAYMIDPQRFADIASANG